MTDAQAVCQFLGWDTDFFGKRIARLNSHTLNPMLLAEAETWCQHEHIDCLYFLAESDDQQTVAVAEQSGFQFVDVRITLERSLSGAAFAAPPGFRLSTLNDIPQLAAIARISHTDSRYYFDPHFDRARCNDLYETWIDKSCRGYADAVWVCEREHEAVAYITCHLDPEQTGRIGLVGVGDGHQGAGIGSGLIQAALAWFSAQDMQRVTVVTQGRNVRAQRLYQRAGFTTRILNLWYHRWFNTTEVKSI